MRRIAQAGSRIDAPTRAKLAALREAYEAEHCAACGFTPIYPPAEKPTDGGPEKAAALLERYEGLLATASDLYHSQSLNGSRRDSSAAVVVLPEPPRLSSSRQLTPQTLEIDAAEFGQFIAQQRAALAAARERERKVAAAALRMELHAALSSCRGRVRRRRFLDVRVR